MPRLDVHYSKTLKLTNVLQANMSADIMENMSLVEKMENYIKSKGYLPIGPLIQHIGVRKNENGEPELSAHLLRQVNGYINQVEPPYEMTALLRVPDCVYVRFIGPQEKIDIAHSKLTVTAYEEDIPLVGSSYTVFVNQLDNEDIVADVFMEKVHD